MKKAFTLAEVLITLSIIGIIAAITLPTVFTNINDNDYRLYKSAFKNVESIVNELSSDYDEFDGGVLTNNSKDFCYAFVDRVNTIGTTDCTTSANPEVSDPDDDGSDVNFITTNGMRWYGLHQLFADDASFCNGTGSVEVFVDIDGVSSGQNTKGSDILEIMVCENGSVEPGALGDEADYLLR